MRAPPRPLQITALAFSGQHEALWAGEAEGSACRRSAGAPWQAAARSAPPCIYNTTACAGMLAAGTETGHIYTLQLPAASLHAHWQAHADGAVLEMAALGDCCLSLSQQSLALHGAGGAPHFRVTAAQVRAPPRCTAGVC